MEQSLMAEVGSREMLYVNSKRVSFGENIKSVIGPVIEREDTLRGGPQMSQFGRLSNGAARGEHSHSREPSNARTGTAV